MNKLAITQGQKIIETTVTVWSNKTVETMDRLALLRAKNFVEPMVRF